jgi:hypothetical protein
MLWRARGEKLLALGSLVPTHHKALFGIPRKAMRRLDTAQLPAVWSYRTRQVVFGVERTLLCTFNQELFDAQTKTLSREIRKRQRKLEKLRVGLQGWTPAMFSTKAEVSFPYQCGQDHSRMMPKELARHCNCRSQRESELVLCLLGGK